VFPRRLFDQGFVFRYPLWPDAARDLCRQSKLAWQSGPCAA
jgi:hypothetical protein